MVCRPSTVAVNQVDLACQYKFEDNNFDVLSPQFFDMSSWLTWLWGGTDPEKAAAVAKYYEDAKPGKVEVFPYADDPTGSWKLMEVHNHYRNTENENYIHSNIS